MTHKLTSTNTGRADTEQCSRCGRRKRSDRLEPSPIGRLCRHCASVIAEARRRARAAEAAD